MQVQDKDLYHGATLTQIVEHPSSFKALNRASPKYGHYLINTDRHIYIKYRKNKKSPWVFTCQPDELEAVKITLAGGGNTYLCLVCGTKTVCALNKTEIRKLLDLENPNAQFVRVEVPKGGSCHLKGSAGALEKTVPHSSFPDKVFG